MLKWPLVNGPEVLQRMKAASRTCLILMVILVSSRAKQEIVDSYRLGVNSAITKPADFEQFTEAVRTLGLYWVLLNQAPILTG
jgi:DNA-binding NarL/FixJ family response regulator